MEFSEENLCKHIVRNLPATAGTVDELLAAHEAPPMSERRPFLLLGELANPYRLQDIGIGPLPIYTIRLSGLCRTYADAFDNREVKPGVLHITLARTAGWWEQSHLALATIDQMKQMVTWLRPRSKRDVEAGETC